MANSKTDSQVLGEAAIDTYLTRCDVHYCLGANLDDAIDASEVRSVLRRVLERCERLEKALDAQVAGEQPRACTVCDGECRLGDAE